MSTNHDPEIRQRAGMSTQWNAHRDIKIALVKAGHAPCPDIEHDDFYAISFHTSTNGGYTTQNKIRKDHPDLDTHVHKVTGKEWAAEIHVKVRKTDV